ncbi:MAG: HIT family protein [Chloroflexales bacterium]|nr:HIT family protein [Chloroflexales bacterium]
MASVFSRIIRGELPAAKVYEDDLTLAFLDINPASPGHTLVICKEEYPGLIELPADLIAAVAQTTQRVAKAIQTALHPDGFNIVQNNGAAAGQVVFHYHVHIIPRWEGDRAISYWRPGTSDPETLQVTAAQINAHIDKETP